MKNDKKINQMFCYIKNMYDICSQNRCEYTQIYEKIKQVAVRVGACRSMKRWILTAFYFEKMLINSYFNLLFY